MAPKFSEIPPLFKADRRTVLIFEPKDGKIIVSYANWGENKVALKRSRKSNGKAACDLARARGRVAVPPGQQDASANVPSMLIRAGPLRFAAAGSSIRAPRSGCADRHGQLGSPPMRLRGWELRADVEGRGRPWNRCSN